MIREIKERFIKLFKSTEKEKIKKPNISQKKKELFDDIQIGDIVVAKMPFTEENLNKIPEGHRVRPYYIAYINENHFLAYPSSSSPYKNIDALHSYYLNQYLYPDLDSDCYFDLRTEYVLPRENVYRYACSVKKNDYNQIQRRLYFIDNNHYISLYKEKPLLCEASIGDIIKSNKRLYLIFSVDDNNYSTFQVSPFTSHNPKNCIYIHLDAKPYYVHPGSVITFTKDTYDIVSILSNAEIQDVIRGYNKYLKKHKKKG